MKEIILENNLIRHEILRGLYLRNHNSQQRSYEELIKELSNYSKDKINKNLEFLKDEELIDYIKTFGAYLSPKITSKGIKLVEEIELQRIGKGGKIRIWILTNASWIVPSILEIIKLIKGT